MIKYILWDIDNTLLSFDLAEKAAMTNGFSKFNLDIKDDNALASYKVINDKYWKRLERGEMTRKQILGDRFREFFDFYNINYDDQMIDDFNLYFQQEVGRQIFFNDKAWDTVGYLNKDYDQYAVTNGSKIAQDAKVVNSGLDKIFKKVFISENLGYDKPYKEFFDLVFEDIGSSKRDEYILIGDSLTSDMRGANNAGIKNIWYNPHAKKNHLDVKLDYTIHTLDQVPEILKKING